jgi:hypothetical protein
MAALLSIPWFLDTVALLNNAARLDHILLWPLKDLALKLTAQCVAVSGTCREFSGLGGKNTIKPA